MKKWQTVIFVMAAVVMISVFSQQYAGAAENIKIATVSIQDVLVKSTAGQEAKKVMEAEVAKYREKIQKDEEGLNTLRQEIEKKGSVWSAEVRAEKEREYQKIAREVQTKSEDAQFALQQLEKKVMEPILKELHEVFAEVGKKEGYALILEKSRVGLESRVGLLYADDTLDISDKVREALEKRLAKKK